MLFRIASALVSVLQYALHWRRRVLSLGLTRTLDNQQVRFGRFADMRPPQVMSALGQKQTSEHVRVMSALPPKADIGTQSRNVRFVPKADIVPPSTPPTSSSPQESSFSCE